MQSGQSTIPQKLGPFEISGVLGRGGSGVVYRAGKDGEQFALKVLTGEGTVTAKQRGRFLREARHLARLEHPNLVRIRECGELDDGTPFIAMEFLEGTDLGSDLAGEPMPVARALTLFAQLASAVDALHQAGLIHRDLKPANVMLVDGGQRAVVLDLGIAREVDAPASTTTEAGVQRGTPAYMAPERLFGAAASRRSDLYELGLLFYVMFVGAPPWKETGDAPARLSPSVAGDRLPRRLRAVVLRALDPDPESRPGSAAELVGALRAANRRVLGRRLVAIPVAASIAAIVLVLVLWQLAGRTSPSVAVAGGADAGGAAAAPDDAGKSATDASLAVGTATATAADAAAAVAPDAGHGRRNTRRHTRRAKGDERGARAPAERGAAKGAKVEFPWRYPKCRKLADAWCDRSSPEFDPDDCASFRRDLEGWRYSRYESALNRDNRELWCASKLAKLED